MSTKSDQRSELRPAACETPGTPGVRPEDASPGKHAMDDSELERIVGGTNGPSDPDCDLSGLYDENDDPIPQPLPGFLGG